MTNIILVYKITMFYKHKTNIDKIFQSSDYIYYKTHFKKLIAFLS